MARDAVARPSGRTTPPGALAFLMGGGEMGERIRAFDWERTPLGPPATWPDSLKTAVRIMLSSRQPIWIGWGPELTYLYNDAYLSIIGGKHPRALGQPTALVWSEIWDDIQPLLAKAMTGDEGTYVEAQLLIMERSGYPEETYYTFSYTPIPEHHGQPGGIICANTDDTQRVIGERQLTLLRDLAAATIDVHHWRDVCTRSASALAGASKDLPFALLYMTEPGTQRAQLTGAAQLPAGHAAAPASFALDRDAPWPVAEALERQAPVLVEDLAARFGALPGGAWPVPPSRALVLPVASGQAGRAGALVVGLNPYRVPDEAYRGFLRLVANQIGAAIAIADAYEEAKRRADTLTALDRAKTSFFSNVSHELRTPLTLLLGPLQDALRGAHGPLGGTLAAELAVAERGGRRLLKLVNTLLDFSRIEAGRVQAAFEPTDLAAVTMDLASSFRSAVEKAGMRLVLDCSPLPEPVYVDRDMWEKVVLNLLSNAFKHTFDGELRVGLRAVHGAAELTIGDTGTGIPAEALPRLFERFYRVEGSRGRTHEGTGIGLALVAELVRLHGGTVGVRSVLGDGSEFTVRLPFGTDHLPGGRLRPGRAAEPAGSTAAAYVEEATGWLGNAPGTPVLEDLPQTPAPEVEAPGERPTLVVADDNADLRGYLTRLLGGRYRVIPVADGEAALAAVARERPALVLTDVMMPRLDGVGLLRALREDPATRTLPVIMLSARAGEEASIAGRREGADDYLVKPFSSRELLARVEAQLRLARVRHEALGALQRAHDTFYGLIANAPFGVYVVDADFRLIEVSAGSRKVFAGVEPLLGRDFAEVLRTVWPEPFASEAIGVFRRVLATGEPYHSPDTTEARGNVDATESYDWRVERMVLPDGRFGVVCYFFDLTERVRAGEAARAHVAQVAALMDRAPLGVYMVDADLRIRHVNPVAQPVFAAIAGGVEGRDFAEVIRILWPPAFAEELIGVFRHTLATGESFVATERSEVRADTGVKEYYEWRLDRIPQPDGRHGLVCYFREISAQVEARQAIERLAAAERARADEVGTLMQILPIAVWTAHGPGATRITGNEFAARLLGVEDAVNHSATAPAGEAPAGRWLTADGREANPADLPVQRAGRTGEPVWNEELRFEDGRGRTRLVEVSAVPLRDASGAVHKVIATGVDITERKQIEEELRLHREELQRLVEERTAALHESQERLRIAERMASLGTLSAGLGHDMGNLMVPVRVRLEALRRMELPETAQAEVAGIRSAADYLQRLAGGLRLLALDPERAAVRERVELGAWWEEAEPLLRNVLPRGVRLRWEAPPTPLWVGMPRAALFQAVFNLVQNAGDVMRDGVGSVVTVTARAVDGRVHLTVSDDGPGMSEEVRRRCLEPFFTTKTRGMSTGLGLALVYGLVRDAEGALEVESTPGEGSTFRLVLPAASLSAEAAPGPRRLAVVHLANARLRALVTHELRGLAYEVAHEPARAAEADLVVADRCDLTPAPAGVLVCLMDPADAPEGVVALGPRPRFEELRATLRGLAGGVAAE